jgi:hypothetical protein
MPPVQTHQTGPYEEATELLDLGGDWFFVQWGAIKRQTRLAVDSPQDSVDHHKPKRFRQMIELVEQPTHGDWAFRRRNSARRNGLWADPPFVRVCPFGGVFPKSVAAEAPERACALCDGCGDITLSAAAGYLGRHCSLHRPPWQRVTAKSALQL